MIRDADLAVDASDILFQSWSGIYLCDELADEMLESVEQVYGIILKLQNYCISSYLSSVLFSELVKDL